jgi:hypothetical protein
VPRALDHGAQLALFVGPIAAPTHDARGVGDKGGGQIDDAKAPGEHALGIVHDGEGEPVALDHAARARRVFVFRDADDAHLGHRTVQRLERGQRTDTRHAVFGEEVYDDDAPA